MFGKPTSDEPAGPSGQPRKKSPTAVLLRIFFTTYGKQVILICCGYDKSVAPSKSHQDAVIAEARKMVEKAHAGLRERLRKEKKR